MQSGWQKLQTPLQSEALQRISRNAGAAAFANRGGGFRIQDAALRRLATVHGILAIGVIRANPAELLDIEISVRNPIASGVKLPVSILPEEGGTPVVVASDEWEAVTLAAGGDVHAVAEVTASPEIRGERKGVVPNISNPIADAGPDQNVLWAEEVTLDGSGSVDPDGYPLQYFWEQVNGDAVELSDPNAVGPTFTAPSKDEPMSFLLTVFDGFHYAQDTVVIHVTEV